MRMDLPLTTPSGECGLKEFDNQENPFHSV